MTNGEGNDLDRTGSEKSVINSAKTPCSDKLPLRCRLNDGCDHDALTLSHAADSPPAGNFQANLGWSKSLRNRWIPPQRVYAATQRRRLVYMRSHLLRGLSSKSLIRRKNRL